MRHARRRLWVLVAVGAVYACSEVGTDPAVPVAIEIQYLHLEVLSASELAFGERQILPDGLSKVGQV